MSLLASARPVAVALAVLALAPPARAQDVEMRPYRVRIVLHLARHPVLTEVFRIQLERALHDMAHAALARLGQVEVVGDHKALPQILEKGLQRGLDGWQAEEDIKTHFVLIGYESGVYQIEARQYDGWVGLASPVVRRASTRDRDYVGRTMALLLKRDFGLTGEVRGEPDSQGRVKVALRGGGLGVSLDRWIQKDEVLALVQMSPSGRPAGPADWAFLQVLEPPRAGAEPGVCTARLFSRFDLGGISGFRCIKLGTQKGPLTVQLARRVQGSQQLQPLGEQLLIQVRRDGFEEEGAGAVRGYTDRRDAFSTAEQGAEGAFEHLAFVLVYKGEVRRARVPVPLLDDQPVVIALSPASRGDDPLRLVKESWVRAVADAFLRQGVQFQQISSLASQGERRGEALAIARRALDQLRRDNAALGSTRQTLAASAGGLSSPELAQADERLRKIREGEQELVAFIEKLEKIEEEEKDPRRKEALAQIEQARLLEKEGELGKAIAVYEKIPEDLAGPSVQEKLAALKKLWLPRSDEHQKARHFIYQVWPGLEPAQLKERLAEAQQAFAVCKGVDDRLGPRKLLDGTVAHALALEKRLAELKPSVNVEDEKPAKLIEELTPLLGKLAADIDAFLKGPAPSGG